MGKRTPYIAIDMPTLADLSDRARSVFQQVVDEYLESGNPVGSKTLARLPGGLGLSAASIRSILAELEGAGLLASPHTSAGRMPTDTGLRLFVDGMIEWSVPGADERAAIEAQLQDADRSSAAAIERMTGALSGLAACAAVVMVPKGEVILSQVAFTPLTDRRALARIEKEISQGRTALDSAARDIVARGLATWSRDERDRAVLIVRGQAHLIDDAAAADLERVRQLLDDIDGKEDLLDVLDLAREARAMKIFIGSENKLYSLSGSSVIASPYQSAEGRILGVVGVIGPTRLNYARIIPMVDYTAKTLSRLMK
jgi:heat-inducible transcriptional repressor